MFYDVQTVTRQGPMNRVCKSKRASLVNKWRTGIMGNLLSKRNESHRGVLLLENNPCRGWNGITAWQLCSCVASKLRVVFLEKQDVSEWRREERKILRRLHMMKSLLSKHDVRSIQSYQGHRVHTSSFSWFLRFIARVTTTSEANGDAINVASIGGEASQCWKGQD